MYNFFSTIIKYAFILIIYLFIFNIMKMIYLDIQNMTGLIGNCPYLKLINRKDTLPFKIKEVYPLDKTMSIGRKNDNHITIKDPTISNYQAKIVLNEDYFLIKDENSANGTFINGEKIIDTVMLQNGDRIKMGQVEFLYVDTVKEV
ncbi:FHA domain-containing protein [Anaeromicrobium sediminis]|uniref:FHA domain-containing protein n=1 Tax=Anaeromicrobium sediminis TaxID=1478221 RepID=A0A267MG81_9FIRM|nr:FHA domain-containing protein [Anaeromicrobium sediminis]PAB58594.1 FHA domain-containing protein [Anaeromicrobium sediminis]